MPYTLRHSPSYSSNTLILLGHSFHVPLKISSYSSDTFIDFRHSHTLTLSCRLSRLLPLRILAPPACRYEGTRSKFVGSQFIFRFDFQVKIFNNSYFMLTRLSAYLRVSGLLMITRVRYGA